MALPRKRSATLKAFHREAAVAQTELRSATQDLAAAAAKTQQATAEVLALLRHLDALESRLGPDETCRAMRQDLTAQLENLRAFETDANARLARFAKLQANLTATVASVEPPAD